MCVRGVSYLLMKPQRFTKSCPTDIVKLCQGGVPIVKGEFWLILVGGYHYALFPLLVICESVYMASVLVSRCEYVLHGRVRCMKVCVWVGSLSAFLCFATGGEKRRLRKQAISINNTSVIIIFLAYLVQCWYSVCNCDCFFLPWLWRSPVYDFDRANLNKSWKLPTQLLG